MYVDVDITKKNNIVIGLMVDIIEDKNKTTQEVTRGCVKRIISNSDRKKGIKVELTNGAVGTVVGIPSKADIQKETFKFYNLFFHQDKIFAIWDKKANKYLVLDRVNKMTGMKERTLLLFSSEDIAKEIIKGTSLDNRNYLLRPIKRRKPIITVFKEYGITVYSIDTKRKLTAEKMKDLEEHFTSF